MSVRPERSPPQAGGVEGLVLGYSLSVRPERSPPQAGEVEGRVLGYSLSVRPERSPPQAGEVEGRVLGYSCPFVLSIARRRRAESKDACSATHIRSSERSPPQAGEVEGRVLGYSSTSSSSSSPGGGPIPIIGPTPAPGPIPKPPPPGPPPFWPCPPWPPRIMPPPCPGPPMPGPIIIPGPCPPKRRWNFARKRTARAFFSGVRPCVTAATVSLSTTWSCARASSPRWIAWSTSAAWTFSPCAARRSTSCASRSCLWSATRRSSNLEIVSPSFSACGASRSSASARPSVRASRIRFSIRSGFIRCPAPGCPGPVAGAPACGPWASAGSGSAATITAAKICNCFFMCLSFSVRPEPFGSGLAAPALRSGQAKSKGALLQLHRGNRGIGVEVVRGSRGRGLQVEDARVLPDRVEVRLLPHGGDRGGRHSLRLPLEHRRREDREERRGGDRDPDCGTLPARAPAVGTVQLGERAARHVGDGAAHGLGSGGELREREHLRVGGGLGTAAGEGGEVGLDAGRLGGL